MTSDSKTSMCSYLLSSGVCKSKLTTDPYIVAAEIRLPHALICLPSPVRDGRAHHMVPSHSKDPSVDRRGKLEEVGLGRSRSGQKGADSDEH